METPQADSYARIVAEVEACDTLQALEARRVALLGKKGDLTQALKAVASLPPQERKRQGQALNDLKKQLQEAIEAKKQALVAAEEMARLEQEWLDVTLPPTPQEVGRRHPVTHASAQMQTICAAMGFSVRTGPLIEDDDHNFTALNIPPHHPARQMHDTFYLNTRGGGGLAATAAETGETQEEAGAYLLRTHTSPVQIRTMRRETPPIRIIAPGATFRCDSDQTHTPMFHQLEGLYVDKGVHMGHLKGCVTRFLRQFFDDDALPIRFRPSFFPFTEPSAEIDIGCTRERGNLTLGGTQDWLEVMGCGMVHPNVLRACNLDPATYQGFAFGMGVERLAMLKYNIPDVRTFFHSEQAWLEHYGFPI